MALGIMIVPRSARNAESDNRDNPNDNPNRDNPNPNTIIAYNLSLASIINELNKNDHRY